MIPYWTLVITVILPLDLLEVHGSEKIVHGPRELEANKEQIINTLGKNYDISAYSGLPLLSGPTVTLYEIVRSLPVSVFPVSRTWKTTSPLVLPPSAFVLSLPFCIPWEGSTIGIEVPNVKKKTVVGMRGSLASEKFINNTFALPIAIGKKIDNENFIVDLAAMPHLS